MSGLIFHPKTAMEIDRYLSAKSPALIIQGRRGSGKATLAYFLAHRLLNMQDTATQRQPSEHILTISASKNQIGIDEIRKLIKYLRLKSVNIKTGIKRVVIINQAESMSLEAQNSILKVLEEPPLDSCIILTTDSSDKLLPTIISRCQLLNIRPISKAQAKDRFKLTEKQDFDSLYNLSGGLIGLLSDLIYDRENHIQADINSAKTLLNQTVYERLTSVDNIQKDDVEALLNGMLKIAHSGSKLSVSKNRVVHKRWFTMLANCQTAIELLKAGAHQKLILSWLMMVL